MLLLTGKGDMIRHFAIVLLKSKIRLLSFMYGIALPVRCHKSWLLYGRPKIVKRRGSTIQIGSRFTACSQPEHNSIGVCQKVFIRTCTHEAKIVIGDNVGMSGCTVSAHKSIVIGDNVLIGSGALITDSDAHSMDVAERRKGAGGASEPVEIGKDVFIGARAIILKGVTIGSGAVVGAGAVVSKNVPPMTVVAGNPARVVKALRSEVVI